MIEDWHAAFPTVKGWTERVAAGCVSMVCDSSIACVWAGRPRAGWAGPRWNMKMDDQPENNKY